MISRAAKPATIKPPKIDKTSPNPKKVMYPEIKKLELKNLFIITNDFRGTGKNFYLNVKFPLIIQKY